MTDSEIQKGYSVKERDGSILDFEFTRGSDTEEDSIDVAHNALTEIQEILQPYGENEGLLLVQLTDQDGVVSRKAHKFYKEVFEDARLVKVAVYGGLAKYRNVAKLVLPLDRKADIQVFDSKHDAMKWLLQG